MIDSKEAREFTVEVRVATFRPACLRLQDGPGICFARLQQELEGETQESRAEAHLSIRERDIQEYLEGRYPRRPLVKQIGLSMAGAIGSFTVEPKEWRQPAALTPIEFERALQS